jgi:hypothetical protein
VYTPFLLAPCLDPIYCSGCIAARQCSRCIARDCGAIKSETVRKPDHLQCLTLAQLPTSHVILGGIIIVGLLAQVALGIQHHRRFVLSKEQTWMGQWHRLTGPVLLICGISNVTVYVVPTSKRYIYVLSC